MTAFMLRPEKHDSVYEIHIYLSLKYDKLKLNAIIYETGDELYFYTIKKEGKTRHIKI